MQTDDLVLVAELRKFSAALWPIDIALEIGLYLAG